MEKYIIRSEKEWYEFCKRNCIGHIQRRYGSQCCQIDGGIVSEFGFSCDDEWVSVHVKPISYPCIFTYFQDCNDKQWGMFIYESDFINIFKEK